MAGPRRRRWRHAVLALVVVAALGLLVTAPPGPRATVPATFTIAPAGTARGVVHVHTTRSDGSGTIDEVAAAASRDGLQFVITTDHGDGTRPPLAPAYRSGVLCLDGVEISTTGGHYLAFGLGTAPYRLAGAPADVVEDVRRLGGFGVAAHPDSSKPALAWADWTVPIDGLEWFNLDSEWRDDGMPALARALIHYPLRPVAALGSLANRRSRLLERWAGLARERRVIGIAGVDAHARLGTEGDRAWMNVRLPSYESVFAAAQVTVELDAPLSGDGARDAAAILAALREGRSFSTITARAPAGRLAIQASRGEARARMGQVLGGTGKVAITVQVDAPRDAVVRIVCDDHTVTQTLANASVNRVLDDGEAGHACQAIVGFPGSTEAYFTTWAVTNPVYLRPPASEPPPPWAEGARHSHPLGAPASWGVEYSPGSDARVAPVATGGVQLTYALAPGDRASQYAAIVTPDVGGIATVEWLKVVLSADAPMRASLQLRTPDGHRWGRSVAIGPDLATLHLPIGTFTPVDAAPTLTPDHVRSILVVVDTVNTPPGRRGTVTLHDLRAETSVIYDR